MKNSINNSQLGHYLAGLIEGDGSIWTSKTFRSAKGRINNPIIKFTYHKKELPLFNHIKEVLKTGTIYGVKGTNCYKYGISETHKLIEVINLINGKFRTPKIKYLHRAIDHINLVHNTDIEKLPIDTSSIDSSPWLAGFTDADGNFIISLEGIYGLNNSAARGRVKCTFSITQRVIDKPTGLSCIPFMSEISYYFQCKINFKANNSMTFLAQADNKHYIAKNYFQKYPLMTSKHLNYLAFVKGIDYLGKRLTNKEISEVQGIKNNMNNKRIHFNWDQLKDFYI